MPGRPAEDLLGILTCRFADGREIALGEFPLASALRSAETVRAEEIVLTTPDGRSVTTLVNATPIHAEDGRLQNKRQQLDHLLRVTAPHERVILAGIGVVLLALAAWALFGSVVRAVTIVPRRNAPPPRGSQGYVGRRT